MAATIASILNFAGPDMMVILLIVFLLFGAKKLPELARGMGKAVKEFSAARDEIERELSESSPSAVTRQNYSTKQASTNRCDVRKYANVDVTYKKVSTSKPVFLFAL
jgi:sec-independent protein translocase protein TatA